ncbi:MAG: hypothetical protein ACHRXM_30970 [Isosphaerales bacterium]
MAISMNQMPFGEVLEAVDRLTPEEQMDLAAILQRRLAERGRMHLADDVREARHEFVGGACLPTTADELMREILP